MADRIGSDNARPLIGQRHGGPSFGNQARVRDRRFGDPDHDGLTSSARADPTVSDPPV